MSDERLIMEGQHARKSERLKKLKHLAEGHLLAIRLELRPFEETENLRMDRVKELFEALYGYHKEILQLKVELARLEEEIYG